MIGWASAKRRNMMELEKLTFDMASCLIIENFAS